MKTNRKNREKYLSELAGPLVLPESVTVQLVKMTGTPGTGASIFGTDGHTDAFVPVTGADFVLGPNVGPQPAQPWAELTAEGAVLTYRGKPRYAVVDLKVSLYPAEDTTDHTVGIGVAIEGDIIGTGIYGDGQAEAGVMANTLAGDGSSLATACTRRVLLQDGFTIQPVCAKEDGDVDLNLSGLSMTVTLLEPSWKRP